LVAISSIPKYFELYVNDLLLQGTKSWDTNKVLSLFPETMAAAILNTPLLEEVKEDRLVWIFENHGNYSVKSGYRNYIKSTTAGDNTRVEGAWSSLWRVAAPPKTKHLLWRICRGCLPTRVRLRGRHVPCPSECPLCDNNEEDDWHILFGCSVSQQVWSEAGLEHVITDVNSVLFDICRLEDEVTVGNIAMVVWNIWFNRNNCVWNEVKDSAKDVALRAAHMIAEWRAVNSMQQNNISGAANVDSRGHAPANQMTIHDIYAQQQVLRWEKPRDGWWKCNVDASFSQNPSYTGWGWCIRDSAGSFIAAGTDHYNHTLTVAEGEAKALLEAIREATSRGWSNIVFESDCKVVVDAVHTSLHGNSELSSIIFSIKSLLQCNSNFEVKFTKRQANMAAHTLARAACSWSSRTFFDNIPRCIAPIIINEMS
jgi:ribonuclease HI